MSDTAVLDITVAKADFADPADAAAIVAMLDVYACDPMGGATPLSDDVRERLVPALAEVPGAFVLLARIDGEAVGIANCFTGFSTFAARPLVNIHDMAVAPAHRGKGVARALFAAIEAEARAIGACKVTLEVLSGNHRAKELYASLGYGDFQLDPEAGHALFWQKRLT
ncbi:GNAT family N-acetyltransferase [Novosphingobium kaempferiae]|uniref:GNAT family N-acetyltransferase n=1 Tax=Novosphingobium kaempferiae TaxID=2896849 RepID=UPI001E484ADB|nr:GNAT family N-acetyltransferase [Novosphingobium kaempferiae]